VSEKGVHSSCRLLESGDHLESSLTRRFDLLGKDGFGTTFPFFAFDFETTLGDHQKRFVLFGLLDIDEVGSGRNGPAGSGIRLVKEEIGLESRLLALLGRLGARFF